MKSHFDLLLFYFLLLLLTSCKKENPIIPVNNEGFAIYFLKDSTLKIKDIPNKDINSLELEETPWISDRDIEFYDFSSHCIYLKMDKSYFFPDYKSIFELPFSWIEKPYVVVAGKKIRYVGYIQSALYTKIPWPFPDISDIEIRYYPSDILHLDWDFAFTIDKRNNEYVKKSLKDLNLLHEGLTVTIDSLWIDNSDTTSIRYQITIKNNEKDNLYVLDSDKMGTGLFHYFTNGPMLYNANNNTFYESIYKTIVKPNPYNYYDINWFTKINAGKSLTRNIALRGYSRLPKGEYHCELTFNNPVNINKKDRLLFDGRYWIGPTKSETIGFNLN